MTRKKIQTGSTKAQRYPQDPDPERIYIFSLSESDGDKQGRPATLQCRPWFFLPQ